MNLRGAKPISDYTIRNFINNIDTNDMLYNEKLQDNFIKTFYQWVESSKHNTVLGLDKFNSLKIVNGTVQTFDHWYWRHKEKRFRVFKGEFMYHSALLKNGGDWKYLDNDLAVNDALIISVPFSDYGSQRSDMLEYLEQCNNLNIPVLLDFAYYPCAKNIDIDLNKFPCVETVTFSISKAFYGAEYLRAGIRLDRNNVDDGIDVFNSVDMVNRISLGIAIELMKNFSVDYNWDNYSYIYTQVCKEYNLTETDCVMFGLGGKEYIDYNRGSSVNRVCISDLIGEKINVKCKQS
jgi:hypothetical protein